MISEIIRQAEAAAQKAVADMVERCKGMPYGEPAYCGFAWVEIPDGRSALVREMKRLGIGQKHWRKGWMVWGPGKHGGQSMDIHEAGASAFAKVLQDAGFNAYSASRAD